MERYRPAYNSGVRSDSAPPIPIAQDHFVVSSGLVLAGLKGVSARRLSSYDVEEIRGDQSLQHTLGLAAGARQVREAVFPTGETLERRRPASNIVDIARGGIFPMVRISRFRLQH